MFLYNLSTGSAHPLLYEGRVKGLSALPGISDVSRTSRTAFIFTFRRWRAPLVGPTFAASKLGWIRPVRLQPCRVGGRRVVGSGEWAKSLGCGHFGVSPHQAMGCNGRGSFF